MKQISIALLLCLCTLAGFAQGGKALDLKEIISGKFTPKNISGVIPIPGDGEHYSQMNADRTQIIKYSFKTGKPVEVLFDAATARECTFKTFDSYSFAPDGSKLLIATETTPIYRHSYTAVHYIYSLKRNLDGKINNIVEKTFGRRPAAGARIFTGRQPGGFCTRQQYLPCETALWQQRKPGDGRRKTERGAERHPDWVYEEEFSFNRALEFSADSQMLAFIRFDEKDVPSYSFPLFAGQAPHFTPFEKYPGEYTYKYPKTGEVNSKSVRTHLRYQVESDPQDKRAGRCRRLYSPHPLYPRPPTSLPS